MNPAVDSPSPAHVHASHILVIEDDKPTSDQITRALEDSGFSVEQVLTGWQGLSRALAQRFDAIVLDIMLPEIDGFSVLSTLRNVGQRVPILLLSALDEVDTRVKGLHAGADDYLVKPFYFDELSARINVLLRRCRPVGWRDDSTLTFGDLTLDTLTGQVTRRGTVINLKARESRLLAFLIQHAGSVVTRSMLFEAVWNYRADVQSDVIAIHITRLRRKISLDGTLPQLIHNVHGTGWVLHA
ncbi:response regulator transcription factor [Paraburkholderia humisilvae]|uniref:Response regulator MprA n=1 Tax=Paraburkholderia humisilvae TaxID=627669 RepID=A0A6J5F5U5_9BURK|nr:response regulator transcription factor [Paraburkholderia humisilvae]CAB3772536.1 Response regulator MprA [Paraburkholderia humisilvae]